MAKTALKQISRLPGASSPTIKKSPLHPQVKMAQAIASAIKTSTASTEARKVSRTVAPNLPGKGKLGPTRSTMVMAKKPTGKFSYQRVVEPRAANRTDRTRNK